MESLSLFRKKLVKTLRYLQACRTTRRKASYSAQYDRQQLIRETLAIKSETERLQSERDHLKQSIDDLSCWGEFSLNDIEQRCGQQLWFYAIPLHDLSVLTDEMLWYLAGKDNRFAYVVVLSERTAGGFPVSAPEPRSATPFRVAIAT